MRLSRSIRFDFHLSSFHKAWFQNIYSTHFSYMLLTYSLFFFRENKNWHWNLELINNKKLDQLLFYKNWFYFCNDHLSLFHFNGFFFSQFIVDVKACAKKIQLNWIYNNQKNFCVDVYNDLMNAFANDHINFIEQNRQIVFFIIFTDSEWFM